MPSPPFVSYFDTDATDNGGLGKLVRIQDMPRYDWPVSTGYPPDSSRYYPTSLNLPSGNTIVVGGSMWKDFSIDQPGQQYNCCIDEVGKPNNRTWLECEFPLLMQPGSDPWNVLANPLNPGWVSNTSEKQAMPVDYPKLFVIPKGLAWLGWPNPDANSGYERQYSRVWPWSSFPPPAGPPYVAGYPHDGGHTYGCAVLLTLAPPYDNSQKVVYIAGGEVEANDTANDNVDVIDFGETSPTWHRLAEGDDLTFRRGRLNSVLLPDGKVFVVGGARGTPKWTPVLESEMYDPAVASYGHFTTMASLTNPRMYHSFAMLLPDGRVLSSGNDPAEAFGGCPTPPNGCVNKGDTYEIYWPPYFFTSSNTWATRPQIVSSASDAFYGLPFRVEYSHAGSMPIQEVVLMCPSSVTHGTDFAQRRVKLEFAVTSTGVIYATAPWTPEVAPPGDYYVVILDNAGVPSEGRFLNLRHADEANDIASSLTWGGTVRLFGDFTVNDADTLRILPGTQVFADADAPSPIRLHVDDGQLLAQGTAANPITLTSMNGSGAVGEWKGVSFNLEGCECTGYGYSIGAGPPSEIEYATIKNAEYGVSIENFEAPNLKKVKFETITNNRHIYVNGTDVFISAAYRQKHCGLGTIVQTKGVWDLLGGTHVVFANATTQDLTCVGETGLADLLVDGLLLTDESSSGAGDSVYFRPETITGPNVATAGRDWGGAFLSYYSSGSVLRYADLGYAANPLYLYYPGSQTIQNSRVHHFAEFGIWAYGMLGVDGPTIDQVLVERQDTASTLFKKLGSIGVLVDQADGLDLTNSEVDLSGYAPADPLFSAAEALRLFFTQGICESPTGTERSLEIASNILQGPGMGTLVGTTGDTGINTSWMCGWTGSWSRSAKINQNLVQGWKSTGVLLTNPANLDLYCNYIKETNRGIKVTRFPGQSGGNVLFRKNRVDVRFPGPSLFALEEDDVQATILGPSQLDRGENELAVHASATKLVRELDPDTYVMNAEQNYWFTIDGLGTTRTSLTTLAAIRAKFHPVNTLQVDVDPFLSGTPNSGCQLPSASKRMPKTDFDPDIAQSTGAPDSGAFRRMTLGQPYPNPGKHEFSMSLYLPEGREGALTLEVFDIRGRRIFESRAHGQGPATFPLSWSQVDSRGNRVESGIYFLRVTGPQSFREIRKVVIAR